MNAKYPYNFLETDNRFGIDYYKALSENLEMIAQSVDIVNRFFMRDGVESKFVAEGKKQIKGLEVSRRKTISTAKQVLSPQDYEKFLEIDRFLFGEVVNDDEASASDDLPLD